LLSEALFGVVEGDGVVDFWEASCVEELLDDGERGRFSDVVGVGFEGESPEGDFSVSEVAVVVVVEFAEEEGFLFVVDGLYGL